MNHPCSIQYPTDYSGPSLPAEVGLSGLGLTKQRHPRFFNKVLRGDARGGFTSFQPTSAMHLLVRRADPTQTLTLRNRFVSAMKSRFRWLRGQIRKAVVDRDALGLKQQIKAFDLPSNQAFAFERDPKKVSKFMEWVQTQIDNGILEGYTGQQLGEAVESAWTNTYLKQAYQKGMQRAREEMGAVYGDSAPPSFDEFPGGVAGAFNQPFHADKVGLIYTRAYTGLKNITDSMSNQLSTVLSDGISQGKNPREMARTLTKTISGPTGDMGITDSLGRFIPAERRAETLARTEIIRAHHAATIQEYRNYGVEGVKVQAEWETAGDGRVCERCLAMSQRDMGNGPGVFTLDQVEGLIPLHPNCRCIALPLDVTDEVPGEVEVPVGSKEYYDNIIDKQGYSFNPNSGYLSNDEYQDYLKRAGINSEAKEQLDQYFYDHSGDDPTAQLNADKALAKHWADQDEVGKTMLALDRLEKAGAKAVGQKRIIEAKSKLDELEKVSPDIFRNKDQLSRDELDDLLFDAEQVSSFEPTRELDMYTDDWNDAFSDATREYDAIKDDPYGGLEIYRRSRESGEPPVQSWTKNSGGANTTPLTDGQRITPDKTISLKELEENNDNILYGYARQRGRAGEAEVLVLDEDLVDVGVAAEPDIGTLRADFDTKKADFDSGLDTLMSEDPHYKAFIPLYREGKFSRTSLLSQLEVDGRTDLVEKFNAAKQAEYRLADAIPEEEFRQWKREKVQAAVNFDVQAGKKAKEQLFDQADKGLEWVPYDLLDEMVDEKFKINVAKKADLHQGCRAFYSRRKINIAKDDHYTTIAHEWGHAVDDYFSQEIMGSGAASLKHIRGPGLRWTDNDFVSVSQGEQMQDYFHSFTSGQKRKYPNGDGYFWEDNWLDDYEGRIYNKAGAGQEWWAMNIQRYDEYRLKSRDPSYYEAQIDVEEEAVQRNKETLDKQKQMWHEAKLALEDTEPGTGRYTDLEQQVEIYDRVVKRAKRKVESSEEDLQRLKDQGQDAWASEVSMWNDVHDRYPELAQFIENKFDSRNMKVIPEVSEDVSATSIEEFTPAKTMEEAVEFAEKSLGVKIEAGNVDLDWVNEFNRRLTSAKEMVGEIPAKFVLDKDYNFGTVQGEAKASYLPGKGITVFNPKKSWDEIDSSTIEAGKWKKVESPSSPGTFNEVPGFHSTGDLLHTLIHEIGHHKHWEELGKVKKQGHALKNWNVQHNNDEMIEAFNAGREISGYSRASVFEFVAEVYAKAVLMGRESIAQEVWDVYKKFNGPEV